ncbi:deoxyguanosinetriphosphate triphosphohydrolase family protein [Shewanella corallii]|uniref:Deoxyguanosinetriphosphate triphosphohydrolase-like protein n=1 Tax=Shewanella corallii TaxID=560080 RepID=A0ABT0N6D0_9GAMM|nr:deoxyguanosinetriphosphate triphosphohydrolase family protein [Shewanella corallii]
MNPQWQARRLAEDKLRRNDERSPFQRDRARILHSAAFRRLQAKTQVLGVGMNDFYRTRLTHSLEVAQIGTGICAQLKRKHPDYAWLMDSTSLIEALCLAHDIGHPPFGHGGEVALNYMMRDHGGFEGNGQTFRILTRLEPYTQHYGMNLSRRTLLGILKYPVTAAHLAPQIPQGAVKPNHQVRPQDWPPVKAVYNDDGEILDWVLGPVTDADKQAFSRYQAANGHLPGKSLCKSLDATIMELADDIAYAVHDLEDAIVMGIVTREQWQQDITPSLRASEDEWIRQELADIDVRMFNPEHYIRKDAIGTLVNGFVTAINIIKQNTFEDPLLEFQARLEPAFHIVLEVLKQFVLKRVVRKPEVQMLEYKGQQMLMTLFEALASDPMRLLPLNTQQRYLESQQSEGNSMRVIADYLSGMTDDFAARLYRQLFTPSVADINGPLI